MSRANYSEDLDPLELGRWRGRVMSAIRGERGQKLLREMAAALDAMPDKFLIARELEADGEHCALGVVGAARGLDLHSVDPEEADDVANLFDIAEPMAREIVWINDECGYGLKAEDGHERWKRVREWVATHIKAPNNPVLPQAGHNEHGN